MDPYSSCFAAGDDDEPAGWAWLGLLILIGVLELLLPRTLSQFTQAKSKKWQWFRWVGVTAFVLLTIHLFFGLPGKGRPKPEPPPAACDEPCT